MGALLPQGRGSHEIVWDLFQPASQANSLWPILLPSLPLHRCQPWEQTGINLVHANNTRR